MFTVIFHLNKTRTGYKLLQLTLLNSQDLTLKLALAGKIIDELFYFADSVNYCYENEAYKF